MGGETRKPRHKNNSESPKTSVTDGELFWNMASRIVKHRIGGTKGFTQIIEEVMPYHYNFYAEKVVDNKKWKQR